MTRNNKPRNRNLHAQLKQRMQELDCIGQSRNEAKRKENITQFGQTVEGIYSIQTMKNYNQVMHEFIEYAKENGAGNRQNLNDVIKKYGEEYLKHREAKGLSIATMKRDKSALNKLLGNDHKITYKFAQMSVHDITRSRNNNNQNNKHFNEKQNADLVSFAKGTGARRNDLKNLKRSDFFMKENRLYVKIQGSKGGKDRIAPVLKSEQKTIINRLNKLTTNQRVFERIHKHADIHSYRREYANNLYVEVIHNKELKKNLDNYYPDLRENVKSEFYTTKGENNTFKGLRENIHYVTQALGHNRLNVTVNHYLR